MNDGKKFPRQFMFTFLHEKRKKRRPKAQGLDQIQEDLRILNINKVRKKATED